MLPDVFGRGRSTRTPRSRVIAQGGQFGLDATRKQRAREDLLAFAKAQARITPFVIGVVLAEDRGRGTICRYRVSALRECWLTTGLS